MVSWMRRQEGTSSLKALLYMDEIFGYFPPSKNPPSKQPMLTLLKQARSFGIGIILSTQNPVDIDYKGLSNIGTWFIGRLQTKQDIQKVIDGLSSANEGAIDKKELSSLISNLEKRNFILKNINDEGIKLFKTRWVLSYLKGPLTKENIKTLMNEKIKTIKTLIKDGKEKVQIKKEKPQNKQSIKPILASNIEEIYNYTSQSDEYYLQPYLALSCSVHFINASKNVDDKQEFSYKFYLDKKCEEVDFEELELLEESDFENKSRKNSNFYDCPTLIQNEKEIKNIQKEFSNYMYRNKRLSLFSNKDLKLLSKQDESLEDFKIRLQDRLNEKIDEDVEKLQEKFKKNLDSLEDKLERQYDKLEKEEAQASSTTTDTIISIGTSILGAFFGRSLLSKTNMGRVASSARKAGKIVKERQDVKYVQEEIEEIQEKIQELKEEVQKDIEQINKQYKISKSNSLKFFKEIMVNLQQSLN